VRCLIAIWWITLIVLLILWVRCVVSLLSLILMLLVWMEPLRLTFHPWTMIVVVWVYKEIIFVFLCFDDLSYVHVVWWDKYNMSTLKLEDIISSLLWNHTMYVMKVVYHRYLQIFLDWPIQWNFLGGNESVYEWLLVFSCLLHFQ
jgi:hypothetical protein